MRKSPSIATLQEKESQICHENKDGSEEGTDLNALALTWIRSQRREIRGKFTSKGKYENEIRHYSSVINS